MASWVSSLIWGEQKEELNLEEIKSRYDFDSAVGVSTGLSVVYFDATWHDTYPWLYPKLIELSKGLKARFYICRVDELGLEDLATELGVKTLPTFQIWKLGEPAGLVEGPKLKTLDAFIKQIGS